MTSGVKTATGAVTGTVDAIRGKGKSKKKEMSENPKILEKTVVAKQAAAPVAVGGGIAGLLGGAKLGSMLAGPAKFGGLTRKALAIGLGAAGGSALGAVGGDTLGRKLAAKRMAQNAAAAHTGSEEYEEALREQLKALGY